MGTLLVTLDTAELDAATLKELMEGVRADVEFVCVSVSERERGVVWSRLGQGTESILETAILGGVGVGLGRVGSGGAGTLRARREPVRGRRARRERGSLRHLR